MALSTVLQCQSRDLTTNRVVLQKVESSVWFRDSFFTCFNLKVNFLKAQTGHELNLQPWLLYFLTQASGLMRQINQKLDFQDCATYPAEWFSCGFCFVVCCTVTITTILIQSCFPVLMFLTWGVLHCLRQFWGHYSASSVYKTGPQFSLVS